MICTSLLQGQKHPFLAKNALILAKKLIFEQFLALDPKNIAICAQILLMHGIPV